MDIEYARLARDLPLPEGMESVPKPAVVTNVHQAYQSPPPEEVIFHYITFSKNIFQRKITKSLNDQIFRSKK